MNLSLFEGLSYFIVLFSYLPEFNDDDSASSLDMSEYGSDG